MKGCKTGSNNARAPFLSQVTLQAPEQGQSPQAPRGSVGTLPGLHLCLHAAQFLSRAVDPEAKTNSLVLTTGFQSHPFTRHEVGKHVGSCHLLFKPPDLGGGRSSAMLGTRLVSTLRRVAHLVVPELSLSCCWACSCPAWSPLLTSASLRIPPLQDCPPH